VGWIRYRSKAKSLSCPWWSSLSLILSLREQISNQLVSVLSSELIFNQKTAGALELALICIFLTAEILSM
jgi:hypothetical protein